MRNVCRSALAVLAVLATLQGEAQATCFTVFDRNENVIYRESQPPVDMSAAGASEREAMRKRGEYLLFIETDRCVSLSFVTGPGGVAGISFDEPPAGVPAGTPTASPALGRPTVRAVGVSRGNVGVMRAQPAPASAR